MPQLFEATVIPCLRDNKDFPFFFQSVENKHFLSLIIFLFLFISLGFCLARNKSSQDFKGRQLHFFPHFRCFEILSAGKKEIQFK